MATKKVNPNDEDPAAVVQTALSREGILTLTLNRPKQMNATSDPLYIGVTRALNAAAADEQVKVVVITGSGEKAFCAGADLEAGFDPTIGKHKSGRGSYHDPVGRFMSTVIAFPKPLVAAVNGLAVGVGLTILPHCDAAYCVPHASFFSPFAQLGVCPEFCSSVLLPRILGPTLATEVLFFGRRLNAQEAKAARLVGDVLPKENFLEHVYARIRPTLAHPNSGRSMRMFKSLTRPASTIAELEAVNASELKMLDVRSTGANSDAAQGVAAMQAAQREAKASGGAAAKPKL